MNGIVVVDLFSGAGGLTEGFYKEGFEVIAHVEKEKWACETLKTRIIYYYLKEKNDFELYNKYIKQSNNYRTLDVDRRIIFNKYPELEEKLNVEVLNKTFGNKWDEGATSIDGIIKLIENALEYNKKSKVDVIIGGPPCQAYSLIGRGRMGEAVERDKRNFLFYFYRDIVEHFKPEVFIFENVPGILTAHKGKIFEQISKEFKEIGYDLLSGDDEKAPRSNVLNSCDFGVHQSRKRMILFGTRRNLGYPNFKKYAIKFNEHQNTKNAIGDLPFLKPGQGNDYFYNEYDNNNLEALTEFQKLMRENSLGVINHKARVHKEQDIRNYQRAIEMANEGKQLKYKDIPEADSTHKNKDVFEDRFKVHGADKIPHTIVAHISKDGHYNIHYDLNQCRSLTVREAARIQSFPDNFKFEGPRTWQFVQVGNAVPPLMAQAIAAAVKKECFENPKCNKTTKNEQLKIEGE